jgi:hypothetical protein
MDMIAGHPGGLESAARWSLRRHLETLTMAWLTSMFTAKP